jgi:hypothetical protein
MRTAATEYLLSWRVQIGTTLPPEGLGSTGVEERLFAACCAFFILSRPCYDEELHFY